MVTNYPRRALHWERRGTLTAPVLGTGSLAARRLLTSDVTRVWSGPCLRVGIKIRIKSNGRSLLHSPTVSCIRQLYVHYRQQVAHPNPLQTPHKTQSLQRHRNRDATTSPSATRSDAPSPRARSLCQLMPDPLTDPFRPRVSFPCKLHT